MYVEIFIYTLACNPFVYQARASNISGSIFIRGFSYLPREVKTSEFVLDGDIVMLISFLQSSYAVLTGALFLSATGCFSIVFMNGKL